MCYKDIYMKNEELKDHSVTSIINDMGIDIIYQENIPMNSKAFSVPDNSTIFISNSLSEQEERNVLLHEIGHLLFDKNNYLANHGAEENNANFFMCLYLVHNEIWEDTYFDTYLIYEGVSPKIARQFNDRVWQFKYQQIIQNGLTHQYDVNI